MMPGLYDHLDGWLPYSTRRASSRVEKQKRGDRRGSVGVLRVICGIYIPKSRVCRLPSELQNGRRAYNELPLLE